MALVVQTWTGTSLLSCVQLVSSSNPFLTLWQLASTEEQLKRETELRTEAEFLSKSLQRGQSHSNSDSLCCLPLLMLPTTPTALPFPLSAEMEHVNKKLSSSHSAKLDKERERQKLERANRKLKQELEDFKVNTSTSKVTCGGDCSSTCHPPPTPCLTATGSHCQWLRREE